MSSGKVSILNLNKARTSKNLGTLLDDYRTEIKKVRWCTKEEVLGKTKLVLISAFTMGFLIYGADLIVRGGLNLIHTLFKLVF